jgi:hypothetical protein
MRTTLDLDDDVLIAVKELARRRSASAGKVLSDLARAALTNGQAPLGTNAPAGAPAVAGFRPFASRGTPVTNELIDALRDAEGI